MGIIKDFAKEVARGIVIDGARDVASSAIDAIGGKIDEKTRKREAKNKKKVTQIAKNSSYAYCDILSVADVGNVTNYEIRNSDSHILFLSETQKDTIILRDFQGMAVAAIKKEKLEKKGLINSSYHQIFRLFLGNLEYGLGELNYSKENHTIKVSTLDWNLWFGLEEKQYGIDGLFSVSKQRKILSLSYLLEYNPPDRQLCVAVTAIAVIEIQKQADSLK